jgi:Flp pilus assembly pilin Flp
MLHTKRGQSVLEYAILMVIIIAALITLQTYIKRGISGRLKSATDDIGSQYSTAKGSNWIKKVTTNSSTNDITTAGVTQTKMLNATVTNTYEYISTNTDNEYYKNTGQ